MAEEIFKEPNAFSNDDEIEMERMHDNQLVIRLEDKVWIIDSTANIKVTEMTYQEYYND